MLLLILIIRFSLYSALLLLVLAIRFSSSVVLSNLNDLHLGITFQNKIKSLLYNCSISYEITYKNL